MKTPLYLLLGFCLATSLQSQEVADSPPVTRRTAAELDELLGPIALYPDALIALILPASTYPSDIVLAARYIATDGNPARVDDKSWDSSVKALTRYPDTLKWLDENLEWTAQVGDAFIEQPVEVMESIQQLRAKARALGNLVDTPQQRIVQDETYIRILPAQEEYIYEPRYDPEVIYYERPQAEPLLYFSSGYGVGSWLNYDCDWHHNRLYRGEWHQGWDYSHDRNHRDREDYYYINNKLTNSREWHPDKSRHHTQTRSLSQRTNTGASSLSRTQSRDPDVNGHREHHHQGIANPKPFAGAPHHGESVRRAESTDSRKPDHHQDTRSSHDSNSKDGHNSRVITPKTIAPVIPHESKNSRDDRDHADHQKKSDAQKGGTSPSGSHHPDTRSNRNAENNSHADETPKHKSPKVEEPQHREIPKHIDAPKHEEPRHSDTIKHHEAPKHQDAPKHEEAPKHHDSPKRDEPRHQEAPKHQDTPKHEAPKHEEAKSHSEPSHDHGKQSDKKKDDDKDKKSNSSR